MKQREKQDEYAIKIMAQVQEMFSEDCENYIDPNELAEDDNATDFMHALATVAPAMIIGRLTGEQYDALEFNHMANRICAQKSNFVKE